MDVGRVAQAATRSAKIASAWAKPRFRSERPLWLFGGASGRSYSDNSRITHQQVLRSRKDVMPFWVIDEDSSDLPTVAAAGPYVIRGSAWAHQLARSAQVIVFSHGVQDVPGMMWNHDAVRVRLGHGLTAFGKTKGKTPRSIKRMTKAIALAPVASVMEQDHKVAWGFPREKLPITGLPRWDAMLVEQAAVPPRERPLVFYAPTSRPWHTAKDASPTRALKPIYDLLSSPRLRSMLDAGYFELAVYFHQITRYRFGTFDWLPAGVRLVEQEAVLPSLIASASMVISDYSSILWDALYLDTPVMFFQFDRSEHESNRGSYIDLQSRLFGPNVATSEQVLDEIDLAIDDGFQMLDWKDDREAWQQRAFAFRDANNAQRVIMAVDEQLSARPR